MALRVEPAVLRGLLLEMLSADPELELVEGSAESVPADVVVMSNADPEDERSPVTILLDAPRSRVLTLGMDGRRAFLFELRPHRTPLGELSGASLLAAVHGRVEAAP